MQKFIDWKLCEPSNECFLCSQSAEWYIQWNARDVSTIYSLLTMNTTESCNATIIKCILQGSADNTVSIKMMTTASIANQSNYVCTDLWVVGDFTKLWNKFDSVSALTNYYYYRTFLPTYLFKRNDSAEFVCILYVLYIHIFCVTVGSHNRTHYSYSFIPVNLLRIRCFAVAITIQRSFTHSTFPVVFILVSSHRHCACHVHRIVFIRRFQP